MPSKALHTRYTVSPCFLRRRLLVSSTHLFANMATSWQPYEDFRVSMLTCSEHWLPMDPLQLHSEDTSQLHAPLQPDYSSDPSLDATGWLADITAVDSSSNVRLISEPGLGTQASEYNRSTVCMQNVGFDPGTGRLFSALGLGPDLPIETPTRSILSSFDTQLDLDKGAIHAPADFARQWGYLSARALTTNFTDKNYLLQASSMSPLSNGQISSSKSAGIKNLI